MDTVTVLASSGCHLFSGCGFPAPDAGIFNVTPYATFTVLGVEVNITKYLILAFGGAFLVTAFFLVAFRQPALVPRGVQNVGEVGYIFVRDQIARQVIGKKGDAYVPFLVTLLFYVWIFNFFSVLPGAQFPVMSRIAFPAALSAMVWLVFNYIGIRNQGFAGYFRNLAFPPGVPAWLYPLLTPIELFSTLLVRPFTLAVRLFANMFAGHLLLVTFSLATWYLLGPHIGALYAGVSFFMTVILTAFELLIQFIQAFVFTLLTAVYIGGALEAHH